MAKCCVQHSSLLAVPVLKEQSILGPDMSDMPVISNLSLSLLITDKGIMAVLAVPSLKYQLLELHWQICARIKVEVCKRLKDTVVCPRLR